MIPQLTYSINSVYDELLRYGWALMNIQLAGTEAGMAFEYCFSGDCVYLKISNLVTFTQSKPDKKITVKFGGDNLDEYRIDDINHLKVLTKEQADRELTKISTLMFKNFAKIIKSDELENYHVKKANKN